MEDQHFSDSMMADAGMLTEGILEQERVLEEPITIRRFLAQNDTPGAFGTQQVITYTNFPATAVLVDLGIAAETFRGGVLSAGDIVLQMRERLRESDENISGSQPGDLVIWRGAEYRLVQRVIPVSVDDVVFYTAHLRRTNSKNDVGGL